MINQHEKISTLRFGDETGPGPELSREELLKLIDGVKTSNIPHPKNDIICYMIKFFINKELGYD